MLVSASDPSAVIKLSEKESRSRSEIWREGHVCQINSCILGTRPALGGKAFSLICIKPKVCVGGGGEERSKHSEWFQLNCLLSLLNSPDSKGPQNLVNIYLYRREIYLISHCINKI